MAPETPPSGTLARIAHELRRRNVVPWTIGYIAGGWLLLELTAYLADQYGWSGQVTRLLPVILGFGILSAITVAWFHGAAGWQRLKAREIAIHATVGLVLVGTLLLWGAGVPGPDDNGSPPLTRLAVLYFKDHGGTGAGGGVAGDLTELVVHRLANVPALDPLPLTAVEPYRGAETPPMSQLVDDLGVGTLVEGSIVRMEDSVRVNAQLFEAETGSHLGSWELMAARTGTSDWILRVAEAVADSVRSRIGSVLEWRRAVVRNTVPAALEHYRRARAIRFDEAVAAWSEDHRAGLELLEEADDQLEEAERLDPTWPDPVAMRAEVAELAARLEAGVGELEPRRFQEAVGHATRALEMAQDSARLLELRGDLLYKFAGQSEREEARALYEAAEDDLREAVRLDPGRARAWWTLSQLLERRGAFEGAYDYAERAQEADSFLELGPDAPLALLMTSLEREQLPEARRWCTEGRRFFPRDQGIIQGCLLLLASLPEPTETDVDEAWELADALGGDRVGMVERRPGWVGLGQTAVGPGLAGPGDAHSVSHVLSRAGQALRGHSATLRAAGVLYEALAWHRLGRRDSTLHHLGEYVELAPAEAPRLASEWWFRDLWDDPGYQALQQPIPTETEAGR
jgi:TolB-like protein